MKGPYDYDPPWSEGPPEERPTCAACGEERYEGDRETCGACGFKWSEIELADSVARAVLRKLGLGTERLRDVIDAVLGETTDPGICP